MVNWLNFRNLHPKKLWSIGKWIFPLSMSCLFVLLFGSALNNLLYLTVNLATQDFLQYFFYFLNCFLTSIIILMAHSQEIIVDIETYFIAWIQNYHVIYFILQVLIIICVRKELEITFMFMFAANEPMLVNACLSRGEG